MSINALRSFLLPEGGWRSRWTTAIYALVFSCNPAHRWRSAANAPVHRQPLAVVGRVNAGPEYRRPVVCGPDETARLRPGGEERTVLEIADVVRSATGSISGLAFMPLPMDDPRVRRPDVSRARRLLNWVPTIPIDVGLQRTVEYLRAVTMPAQAPVQVVAKG